MHLQCNGNWHLCGTFNEIIMTNCVIRDTALICDSMMLMLHLCLGASVSVLVLGAGVLVLVLRVAVLLTTLVTYVLLLCLVLIALLS